MLFKTEQLAIFHEIEQGNLQAVQDYVESGSPLDVKTHVEKKPFVPSTSMLVIATMAGEEGIVQYLVHQGFPPTTNDYDALAWACYRGHASIAEYLLNLRDRDGRYLFEQCPHFNLYLSMAAKKGYLDIVQLLTNHRFNTEHPICDPSDNNSVALRLAASKGHLEVVEYLANLKTKRNTFACSPFAGDSSAILSACKHGQTAVVEYFFNHSEHKEHYRWHGQFELGISFAAHNGQLDVVDFLLQQKYSNGDYMFDPTAYEFAAIRMAEDGKRQKMTCYLYDLLKSRDITLKIQDTQPILDIVNAKNDYCVGMTGLFFSLSRPDETMTAPQDHWRTMAGIWKAIGPEIINQLNEVTEHDIAKMNRALNKT